MKRGAFNNIIQNKAYSDASKDWLVELQRADMFWYELLMSPSYENFDTKKLVKSFLTNLKQEIENCLEKRFIYFICYRKKVRFSTNRTPKFGLFNKKLHLYLEVGQEKVTKKISVSMIDSNTMQKIKPKVEVDQNFITISEDSGNKTTLSVHDFLQITKTSIGIYTEVHYVGFTKNPDIRPINGQHTGLNDVLYRVSNEDNDIFICFNLFKVLSSAVNNDFKLNFTLANSMINEIGTDEEGLLIEKCFIMYFNAINQFRNKESEKSELKNRLKKLASENKINSIQFQYELEAPNEYYTFFSTEREPQARHLFTAQLDSGEPTVTKGSTFFLKNFQQAK